VKPRIPTALISFNCISHTSHKIHVTEISFLTLPSADVHIDPQTRH